MKSIQPESNRECVAAIDVGSNSTHLVVARLDRSGAFQVIESEKEQTRLAADMDDRLLLDSNSLAKMVAVLKKMRSVASRYNAPVRCLATHTLREARNGPEFAKRLSERCGFPVEIISGLEEARLVAVGVMSGLNLGQGSSLIVDVGGGSVELVVCVDGVIEFSTSLKLGAVRLTKKFLSCDPFTDNDLASLQKYIDSRLEPVCRELARFNLERAVASSGTIKALKAFSLAMHAETLPKSYHGLTLSCGELVEVSSVLYHNRSLRERKMLPQLDSKRADVIVAGAMVLRRIVEFLNLSGYVLSTTALREGILTDTISRIRGTGGANFGDVRWRNVIAFGDKLGMDSNHATHVRELAMKWFDQTELAESAPPAWRDMLGYAAYLHECGKFLNLSSFHKHGYYLIKNSHILGFTQRELETMALLVRYHRKRMPRSEDDELENLEKSDVGLFCKCAALLRVATCLNRGRLGRVRDVVYERGHAGAATLLLKGAKRSELSSELYEAENEKASFEKEFRVRLSIEFDSARR